MPNTGTFLPALALLIAGSAHAQCMDQVSHMAGTAVVAGTIVTATPFGFNTYFADCGGNSGPYLCGDQSGPGGWVFTFNPAVDSVMLDFSALHKLLGNYEEYMRVFVNGVHYAIPAASTVQNSCLDELAELTAQGDVGASFVGSSGWSGTVVPGPITELMVEDSIPFGSPGGAFCSLFICPHAMAIADAHIDDFTMYPNPASTFVNVRNKTGTQGVLSIADMSGAAVMHAPVHLAPGTEQRIATDDLAAGQYLVRLTSAQGVEVRKLTVVR